MGKLTSNLTAAAVAAAALAWSAPSLAGVILTAQGRGAGKVAFAADGVSLDGSKVAWPAVLLAVADCPEYALPERHAVRAADGELWCGQVLGVGGKKVSFSIAQESPAQATGEGGEKVLRPVKHEIGQEAVLALEFQPAGASVPQTRQREYADKTLYRRNVEPLPGTLLWIDDARIAIDSPLGVLTVPRADTIRYVYANVAPQPLPGGDDEIHLVTGSILRGRMSVADGSLRLEHAALGKLAFPLAAVKAVRRRPAGTIFLADLAPESVKTAPLIAGPTEPKPAAGFWPGGADRLQGLTIEAGSVVRYRLAAGAATAPDSRPAAGATLCAVLAPPEGARGGVKVRIAAGGKTIFQQAVAPGDKPQVIRQPIGQAGELTIEVGFQPGMQLPAAVLIADPVVVEERQ